MRVDPDGPVPCDLAVVGESPGKEEIEAGRGFVGKSGRILWGEEDLIGSIVGRQRETLWVTNVCKVPCPEDQWEKLPLDEREFWISELLTELNLVKPNLILPFGSRAARVLCPGFTQISRENGKARKVNGWNVMPLWHPAAYLRGNAKVLGELAIALDEVPTLLANSLNSRSTSRSNFSGRKRTGQQKMLKL